MCSCDSGTPCQAHAGTRWDPAYFDPYLTEPEPVSEYQVLDG